MSTASDVESLGLASLRIEGTLTPLTVCPGEPIVFLVDERHLHDSVLQNITNAQVILDAFNVAPICVESHKCFTRPGEYEPLNRDTRFADHFHSMTRPVYGIESKEFLDIQTEDIEQGRWRNEDAGIHPMNFMRSHYYVAHMFQIWRFLHLAPNLMLNTGRKHNDHIQAMIDRGEIFELTGGQRASFVRLRSATYPN